MCSVVSYSHTHTHLVRGGRVWQVLGWELSDADMELLSSFTVNTRMVDGSFFVGPQGPYRTLQVGSRIPSRRSRDVSAISMLTARSSSCA